MSTSLFIKGDAGAKLTIEKNQNKLHVLLSWTNLRKITPVFGK